MIRTTAATDAGRLALIKTYADRIGPWKRQAKHLTFAQIESGAGLGDVNTVVPIALIADADRLGLFVHAYNVRNDRKYRTGD